MVNFTNSEIMERLLQTLVSKIGRKTHESFAITAVHTMLKTLEPKYNFLKFIVIKDTFYTEGIDAVSISPEMDFVESDDFREAVNELVKMTVKKLEGNADFFFIKEFQDALKDIGLERIVERVDLSDMQLEYIVDSKKILRSDNSDVVEHVLKALTCLLNRLLSEAQSIKIMADSVRMLEEKYKFLRYIEVIDTPDSEGFYVIRALPEINNAFSTRIAEALQELISEVSILIEWEGEESFVDVFKNELGEEYLSKIEKMGVNLSYIQTVLSRQEHEIITKKTLDALVKIVGEKTHESFAVATLDDIIKNFEGAYDVLKYVKIDNTHYSEGVNAISIASEVNNVESYDLAKALIKIIKMMGFTLGNKTISFIKDFKKQMGEEYILEIEKIGVNLHFLELKFSLNKRL
jgi:hypothetical protein